MLMKMKEIQLDQPLVFGKEISARRTGTVTNRFDSSNYTPMVNLSTLKILQNTKELLQLDKAQKSLKKVNQHFLLTV